MTKKRILLAEDDPSVLKMTKARLEHEGYDVVAASDGEGAVEQALSGLPIHLILLDVRLPKINGYEVCRRLKGYATTATIPVLIFTASETELIYLADRCIEIGASDWIKKPFRTAELLEKVHRLLGEN